MANLETNYDFKSKGISKDSPVPCQHGFNVGSNRGSSCGVRPFTEGVCYIASQEIASELGYWDRHLVLVTVPLTSTLPSNSQHTPNLSRRNIFSPTLLALQVWNPRQPRVSVEEYEDLWPARTILNICSQLLGDSHGSFLGYLLASPIASYWGHIGYRASRKSLGLPPLPEEFIWLTMHPVADSKRLPGEKGKPTQASAMRILLTVCSSRNRPKQQFHGNFLLFLDAFRDTWTCLDAWAE